MQQKLPKKRAILLSASVVVRARIRFPKRRLRPQRRQNLKQVLRKRKHLQNHETSAKPSGERTFDRSERNSNANNRRNNQKNNQKNQGKQNNNSHRRQRRQHGNNYHREPVVPQTTREDLEKLKVAELREKADELGVDHKGLKKAELVDAVLDASVKAEGFVETAGVLDILSDGYGFLRTGGYLPGENDVYVGLSMIRRNGLRKGDYIKGTVRPARPNEKYAALQEIESVNGTPIAELGKRVSFPTSPRYSLMNVWSWSMARTHSLHA